MKYVFNFFQEAIKFTIFFVISYIWLLYSTENKSFALALAIVIGIFGEIITLMFSRKKSTASNLKNKQQHEAEQMFMSLASNSHALIFFKEMFSTRYKNVSIQHNHLILTNHDNESIIFYPFLKVRPLELDDVLEIAKQFDLQCTIIIICNQSNASITRISPHIMHDITILDKYETYSTLYQEYDFYPEIIQPTTQQKSARFKVLYQSAFNRQKTKSYIIAAAFLLLSSLYSPFALYNKIVASILLFCALLCLIERGRKNKIS